MKTILAIVGSNSSHSIHAELARWLAAQDARVDVVTLRDFEAPLFGVDREAAEGVPVSMIALRERIQAADAVILLSPEHNGSMPAVLKNAIDWMTRIDGSQFFAGAPVLLLSASPGPHGGATNLEHLAQLLPWWGARVVGRHSVGRWPEAWDDAAAEVVDESHRTALLAHLAALGAETSTEERKA